MTDDTSERGRRALKAFQDGRVGSKEPMTREEIEGRIQAAMDIDYQAWDIEQDATDILELIERAGLKLIAADNP